MEGLLVQRLNDETAARVEVSTLAAKRAAALVDNWSVKRP